MIQAEFSVLNANYLNILVHSSKDGYVFKVYDLETQGMPCEQIFLLNDMIGGPNHFADLDKQHKFVAFTQSDPSS